MINIISKSISRKQQSSLGMFVTRKGDEIRILNVNNLPFFLYHFRGGGMSRHSKGLDEIKPVTEVEINPTDAKKLKLTDGDIVELTSRRGNLRTKVKVTDKSAEGMAFITFHYK